MKKEQKFHLKRDVNRGTCASHRRIYPLDYSMNWENVKQIAIKDFVE